MNITTTIQQADLILTECAISAQLRRKKDIPFDPFLFLTPRICGTSDQKYLTITYQQNREIATQADGSSLNHERPSACCGTDDTHLRHLTGNLHIQISIKNRGIKRPWKDYEKN